VKKKAKAREAKREKETKGLNKCKPVHVMWEMKKRQTKPTWWINPPKSQSQPQALFTFLKEPLLLRTSFTTITTKCRNIIYSLLNKLNLKYGTSEDVRE
jgi:hypothetical protein